MNNAAQASGWSVIEPVGEDGSSRRYFRVQKNGATAILMDCSGPKVPGHDVADFVTIANWLRSIGVKAPEIYERGADDKYVLLEDFGETSYKAAIMKGGDVRGMYGLATNVLKKMNQNKCPLPLPNYYDSHVHKGHRRVIDWYLPIVKQAKNKDGIAEAYLAAWQEIEQSLPPCPQGFLHIDFHAENLMWLEQGQGIEKCGVLDFQGGMMGPVPYDLVNLLEDPRLEIDQTIRAGLLDGYDENFLNWYRVLGTQFHCRVIGQFIKLAMNHDKPRYLEYIPTLESYIRDALKHPVLKPLQTFFDDIKLDFKRAKDLNAGMKKELIRSDAF